jgi:SAM-dependent methyltransferase
MGQNHVSNTVAEGIRLAPKRTAFARKDLLESNGIVTLDLNPVFAKQEGAVSMWDTPREGEGIIHAITDYPWPFVAEVFDRVFCFHRIERVPPWEVMSVMNECWRVLRPKGALILSVAYAGSPSCRQDPTFVKGWTENTAKYFAYTEPAWQIYKPSPWTIEANAWNETQNLEIVLRKLVLPPASSVEGQRAGEPGA